MRPLPALLIFPTACVPARDPRDTDTAADADTDTDSDADTDTDSDANTDTDADTDTDSAPPDTGPDSGHDSGHDSDPDTGHDSGPDSGTDDTSTSACTDHDLTWSGEVRDATGTAGTVWSRADDLFIWGIVSNPCSGDVSFRTRCGNTMLSSADVTSSSGMGMGVAMSCDGVATTRVVPAGGSLEEGVEFGRLGVDSYTWAVSFDHSGASASGAFEVR